MKIHNRYQDITEYTTKDGSQIRELMHPSAHGNQYQSLAQAIVDIGQETRLHKHHQSEELYHLTQGQGLMTLGEHCFEVLAGDTVAIEPGAAHKILNTGDEPLVILCCCAPAYSHLDTELL